ncbi:hypothetical protein EMIT0P260_20043 [Pseudomonas sp. IT-P260]
MLSPCYQSIVNKPPVNNCKNGLITKD